MQSISIIYNNTNAINLYQLNSFFLISSILYSKIIFLIIYSLSIYSVFDIHFCFKTITISAKDRKGRLFINLKDSLLRKVIITESQIFLLLKFLFSSNQKFNNNEQMFLKVKGKLRLWYVIFCIN
jgi:hypothetical protein